MCHLHDLVGFLLLGHISDASQANFDVDIVNVQNAWISFLVSQKNTTPKKQILCHV